MQRWIAFLGLALGLTFGSPSTLAQDKEAPPPVALLPTDNSEVAPQPAQTQPNSTATEPQSASPAPTSTTAETKADNKTETKTDGAWSEYSKIENMAQNGQATEALALLEKRLESEPKDAKASYLKGLILMQLGRREAAESWFVGMRQNFPNLPQPYNALAVIYQAQGKLIEAETILRELSVAHPEQKNVHRNRGEIYLLLAQSAFQKAHQQNPDDAMINERLEALNQLLPKEK